MTKPLVDRPTISSTTKPADNTTLVDTDQKSVVRVGIRGKGIGGISSIIVSGNYGISMGESHACCISGEFGFSEAGDLGITVSGDGGTSIVGLGGYAMSGPGGSIHLKYWNGECYTFASFQTKPNRADEGAKPNVLYRLKKRFYHTRSLSQVNERTFGLESISFELMLRQFPDLREYMK